MYRIRNVKHFMTGVFLILVALLAFYISRQLNTFTSIGLGPGFLPRALASIQIVFGLMLVASGFITVGEPVGRWPVRPLIVIAAIVFFGFTIESMGFMVAVTGLVLIACAANSEVKPIEAVVLALGSAVFSSLLFVTALGLAIPVWPQNLWGN